MNRARLCVWSAFLVCSFDLAASAEDLPEQWKKPTPPPPGQVVALKAPLALDGALDEWKSVPSVPMHTASSLLVAKGPHKWGGPSDIGMDVFVAWNADSLCVAAQVTDQEVHNDRPLSDAWQQDSIEFYVDGRAPRKQLTGSYGLGAYPILVRPPIGGRPAQVSTPGWSQAAQVVQVAGRATADGYTVEMLVPWSAFPEAEPKAGMPLGLAFKLTDYDTRDGATQQPRQLTFRKLGNFYRAPSYLTKWALADGFTAGEKTPLDAFVVMSGATVISGTSAGEVSIETGHLPGIGVRRVELALCDRAGAVLSRATGEMAPVSTPYEGGRAALRLPEAPADALDGVCQFRILLQDQEGKAIGSVSLPAMIARHTPQDMLKRIEALNLPSLSQKEPFRATAGLGVAAGLERFKRAMDGNNVNAACAAALEMMARLAVIEQGALPPGDWGAGGLYALAGHPEAQVLVEPPGDITFLCGAIPVAIAEATYHDKPEQVLAAFEQTQQGVLLPPTVSITLDGRPAHVSTQSYAMPPSQWDDFDPAQQAVAVSTSRNDAYAVGLDQLDIVRAQSVVVLPDCPPSVQGKVEAWAREKNIPFVPIEKALKSGNVLVAGDPSKPEAASALKPFRKWKCVPRVGGTTLAVLDENRKITVQSAARPVAEQAARLILASKPVTEDEADSLRHALLQALAPEARPTPLPEGTRLWCGDLHSHTFYSDGSPSPVGLPLEAMYMDLDFLAITDHNTIEGAQLADDLLRKHRVAYPLIVGEEITTWFHMNAYPLKEVVSWKMEPSETVEAAHRQGAVIQWNHPGFPYPAKEWYWEHLTKGLEGTGIDAWEHLPDLYDTWKKAGTLPLMTGTTDTHSSTFGGLNCERTVIFAPAPTGDDVANAIRHGQVAAIFPTEAEHVYGPKQVVDAVWGALAEGKALKASSAEQIRKALKNADVPGLLQASSPRKPETAAK